MEVRNCHLLVVQGIGERPFGFPRIEKYRDLLSAAWVMRDWGENGRWLVVLGWRTAVCRYVKCWLLGSEAKCQLVIVTESTMKNTNSRLATLGNVYI